jgi:hypothetical protein
VGIPKNKNVAMKKKKPEGMRSSRGSLFKKTFLPKVYSDIAPAAKLYLKN